MCSFLLPSSSFPYQGKPQGGSVATQLPGKLFTDFEAWDPLRLQGRRPETRGPKYCHSSFDAITVGKMVPPVPRFLLSSPQRLQGSPELKYKVGRVAIIKYRNPESQAFHRVASPRQAKPCSLLHFPFRPSCAHGILSAGSCLISLGSWALGKHLPWKEGRRLTVTPQLSLGSGQTDNSACTFFKGTSSGR